jgi:sugar phosphate isomerase/epimerase
LASEDPLALLQRVKEHVVTMHASDRRWVGDVLLHGAIGTGLNDYDAIFATLRGVGFAGWISIEDGVNGMDELHQSARFLRTKMAEHFKVSAL